MHFHKHPEVLVIIALAFSAMQGCSEASKTAKENEEATPVPEPAVVATIEQVSAIDCFNSRAAQHPSPVIQGMAQPADKPSPESLSDDDLEIVADFLINLKTVCPDVY